MSKINETSFYTLLFTDLEKYGLDGLTDEQQKSIKELVMEKITSIDKNLNTYHFNFKIDMEDTFSEEELQEISENLSIHFKGVLFNRGYHLPSLKIINKCYQKKK